MAPAANQVQCICCGKWLSPSQERRHRKGYAPPTLKAVFALKELTFKTRLKESVTGAVSSVADVTTALRKALNKPLACPLTKTSTTSPTASTSAAPRPTVPQPQPASIDTNCNPIAHPHNDVNTTFEEVQNHAAPSLSPPAVLPILTGIQERIWSGRTRLRQATVEDAAEDEEEEATGDIEIGEDIADADDNEDENYTAISVWDRLQEDLLRRLASHRINLTEQDYRHLRPFALKVDTHMSGAAFAKLPYAFPDSGAPSWKTCQSQAAQLSGFEPQTYDCCINSCCCFVGTHAEATICPYCDTSRYDANGKHRQQFVYLPIIPRLKEFLANRHVATQMQYRTQHDHTYHDADTIKDVFDADVYRTLLGKKVSIDDKDMTHTFFDSNTDVALGLSTDGFAPFRRRTKTCWPIILFNYNLPPEVRFHLEHILSLGVVPGPKKPADFDSFLWPAVQELLQLELGVHAYDVLSDTFIALRAYLILVFGDIPAMSMVMQMKGHNGFRPCRMCNIPGIRVPGVRQPTHYVPLDRSRHPDVQSSDTAIKRYNATALPLRSHDEIMCQAREVQFAATEAASERLAREYGVKGIPLLSVLSSLTFPLSFPYDFMHLLYENVLKNLFTLWGGDYKKMDTGREDYKLVASIWEAVGAASAESGATIPSAFGPRPPNIASDKISWTADSRSFWALYVGPILLNQRFIHERYYTHFVDLVRLMNLCLQFEISQTQICELRVGFAGWVQKYEEIYYQFEPSRLPACPVTIHALLHIADSIVAAGPVWACWAFPMERYCGSLQPAIRSRRFPYASLNRYVVDHARLTQIKLIYGIKDELKLRPPSLQGYFNSICIPKYDHCVLLPSHHKTSFERGIIDKILASMCTRYGITKAVMRRALLSESFEEWARLRIAPDGDIIRAAKFARGNGLQDSRNASFVRYEQLVDRNARYRNRRVVLEKQTFYGQVQHIIVVNVSAIPAKNEPPAILVLAIIRSCAVEARHPQLDIHYYTKDGPLEVVDVTTIQCLVGRLQDCNRWAIIDRSGSLSRAMYIENDDAADEV